MMLAIAIIALIGMLASVIHESDKHDKLDINLFISAVAIMAWWKICFPFAIVLIGIVFLIGIIGACVNDD